MFLNESEDTRNVLGEFQRVCKRWTSITDRDFAAVENIVSPLFLKAAALPSYYCRCTIYVSY